MYRTAGRISDRRRWCFLVFALFLLTGCGSRLVMPWQSTGKELLARLDEGNRLFMAGDYPAAAAVFQDLRETGHPEVIRPALYGLACSRFMLAGSRQEYLDAVGIFELWQRILPPTPMREDPRMLITLFSGPVSGGGDAPSGSDENALTRMLGSRERIGELEEQIARLRSEAAAYEAQKDSAEELAAANKLLEEKLKAKEEAARAFEEELSKLRGQMRTLETIDQEIQEKKQGISSP